MSEVWRVACGSEDLTPVVLNRGAIYNAQGCHEIRRFFNIPLKIHFQTVIKP